MSRSPSFQHTLPQAVSQECCHKWAAGLQCLWRASQQNAYLMSQMGLGRSNSGCGVKLSVNILAGSRVLSAVGACPPHDGVRRRWWINVASAVPLIEVSGNTSRPFESRDRACAFPAVVPDWLWAWVRLHCVDSFAHA